MKFLAALLLLAQAAFAAYIVEPVERKNAAFTNHAFLPPLEGPVPVKGVPFADATSGLMVTRISDVLDGEPGKNPHNWNGLINAGLHNGYSLYSCANRTGEYVLAFGVTSLSVLYRLSDCASMGVIKAKAGTAIGDKAEPRWSRLATDSPTTIYYHFGSRVYSQDVLIGPASETIVYDFLVPIAPAKDNTELSNDGRYGAFRLATPTTVTTVVLDFVTRTVLLGRIQATVSGVSVTPDGKWTKLTEPYRPGRYYRISDLALGIINRPVERTDLGSHGGWGFDTDGNCVNVYQCTQDDWFKAFDPETQKTIKIIHGGELGWGANNHTARMSNPAKRGWALISTYAQTDTGWSYNQLFMLEIKPLLAPDGATVPLAERPRIWRLGHTQGNFSGGYFSEAFASVDMEGNNVYWGTNWRGGDNLELYRLALPTDWHNQLSGGPNPTPIPSPTATPTPIPTPFSYPVPAGWASTFKSPNGIVYRHIGPGTAGLEPLATPTPIPGPKTIVLFTSASLEQFGIKNYSYVNAFWAMWNNNQFSTTCRDNYGSLYALISKMVWQGNLVTSQTLGASGIVNCPLYQRWPLENIPRGTKIISARIGLYTNDNGEGGNIPLGREEVSIKQLLNTLNSTTLPTKPYLWRPMANSQDAGAWRGASWGRAVVGPTTTTTKRWRFTKRDGTSEVVELFANIIPWNQVKDDITPFGKGVGIYGNAYSSLKRLPGDPRISFNPDKSISWTDDIGPMVQDWVDNPQNNFGCLFDATDSLNELPVAAKNNPMPRYKCIVGIQWNSARLEIVYE